jgi:methylglutaconyl-CoA hydratase
MTIKFIHVTTPLKGVNLVTLNRPEKRNAIDGAVITEWLHTLEKLAVDKSVRVVMFNGNGDHFCAGADIAWMQKMAQASQEENIEDAMHLSTLLKSIYTFSKPTIALIHGATMGGGLGVIACCDMVIAAENASFCFSEAKIGLTPSVISPYIIPVIGERAARYYYLTAQKFMVEKAVELRLVQQISSTDELMDDGLELAKALLKNSPFALAEAKKLIQRVARHHFSEDIIKATAEHLATMRASDDAQEGLQAFLEKRDAVWK